MERKKSGEKEDPGILLRAVEFAAERHRDQRRKGIDASPFINHPIRVASMIANIGKITDLPVLVAAILHDTIEDTCTTEKELETSFGSEVLRIVLEVSDDKSLPTKERKRLQVEHAHKVSRFAKILKIADKCVNIQDISENPPSGWSTERRVEYLNWAEQVVSGCRGVNESLELCFDETLNRARAKLYTL